MARQRILICGAGVAGSVLAFWLARADYDVVVIERSRVDQKLGQGVEIEEPAIEVVRQMGLLDELKQVRTRETGFRLYDEASRCWAKFDVGGVSPTGSLEMMRGDLTQVLYKAANASSNIEYRYQTTVEEIEQRDNNVTIHMMDRRSQTTKVEDFDFVIGADGAKSRTRRLVVDETNCFKPVGAFVAYFSIPKQGGDLPYSKLCHFSKRRVVWLRPISEDSESTSVYLIHIGKRTAFREAGGNWQKQREAMAGAFADCGWETPRVIKQMLHAENFYFDELVQVKLPFWSKGRVALLGDAAWAPTPFTGQGNQLAIIGAWVLAQEMKRNRTPAAFRAYETRLRDYVEECQKIAMGGRAPKLLCPETSAGILVVRLVLTIVSWVAGLLARFRLLAEWGGSPNGGFDLQIEK